MSQISLISELLTGLYQLEAATALVRRAMADYCQEVQSAEGLPYLKARELTDSLAALLEAAVEDLEARGLAKA